MKLIYVGPSTEVFVPHADKTIFFEKNQPVAVAKDLGERLLEQECFIEAKPTSTKADEKAIDPETESN